MRVMVRVRGGSCLLLVALFLVPALGLVSCGFEGLEATTHVPLEHLPVLPFLIPHGHKVPAVVGMVLGAEGDSRIMDGLETGA